MEFNHSSLYNQYAFCSQLAHRLTRQQSTSYVEKFADEAAISVNSVINFNSDISLLRIEHQDLLTTLKSDGYIGLGTIADQNKINDINSYLADKPIINNYYPTPKYFEAQVAKDNMNFGIYSPETVFRCPWIFNILNSTYLLSVLTAYLGCPPTLQHVNIQKSFGGKPIPYGNQFYHRDPPLCVRFFRLFLLLNEVDEGGGGHTYVKGTHTPPPQLNNNKTQIETETPFYGDGVFAEEDVEYYFSKDEIVTLKGRAGSAFLGNTRAIHRGTLPIDSDRILLMATYSIMPSVESWDRQTAMAHAYSADENETYYGKTIFTPYFSYINRILIV